MIVEEYKSPQQQRYYRLISLWVVSEVVAGGIIHGLHLPFSGMVLSGFAVLCICLIAYYQGVDNEPRVSGKTPALTKKGAILKATLIVCVFKMMLSAGTPPSAYFAVFFQGLMGQLLFSYSRNFKLSCMLLGFLALLESALQRTLVLILLYGTDFWKAVNNSIRKLVHVETITNYSLWLALAYIVLHGFFGILIGIWANKLIRKSQSWKDTQPELLINKPAPDFQASNRTPSPKKRKIVRGIFAFLWIILIVIFFQSYFKIGEPILPSSKVLQLLLRSVLIFFTWYLLLSPLLTSLIKKKLQHQKEKSKFEIGRVLLLLPTTEHIFKESWNLSRTESGFWRIGLFWKIVLINILSDG